MSNTKTHILGFPRIGEERKLKWATEKFWRGEITAQELESTGKEIREENWKKQQKAGIDLIPSNDFSFYDQVLDTSALVGNIPSRFEFEGEEVDLETYFLCARGKLSASATEETCCAGHKKSTTALEMTKWFDTNYHYLVPEFTSETDFSVKSTKVFDEYQEAKNIGIETVPVIIGPLTYLYLGKEKEDNFDRFSLLPKLVKTYEEIIKKLSDQGVKDIQIDEPILSLDLEEKYLSAFKDTYQALKNAAGETNIILANYFGALEEKLETILSLPVDAFSLDFVRGISDVKTVAEKFPAGKTLFAGVVNGRNIWKNDYKTSLETLNTLKSSLSNDQIVVSSSCSLIHSPISLRPETQLLDAEIKDWLAFAEEKLIEVREIADLLEKESPELQDSFSKNQKSIEAYRSSPRVNNPEVKHRVQNVDDSFFSRKSPFAQRIKTQQASLKLPAFPTTTIGSFPQTEEIRAAHKKGRNGAEFSDELTEFCKETIRETVKIQEDLDLDVLVHGECERNDMVEYFGRLLDGFAFTELGWVQSFGSRYVKPPIIFGDVSRPKAMTVDWSVFAQSCTDRLMKGMLTGPVTILQWSFVREDIPRSETTWQLGLALRDEVVDLETAGIKIIQIDEPALREGLPLRQKDWKEYLDWAVKAFQISAAGVKDETQIHTHMCYCEFEDIIEEIAALDADVISIENSRSDEALLKVFADFKYPNEIGLGVWDIHSPRVPSVEEMTEIMEGALKVLRAEQVWVNPDCGLKTRGWPESIDSLKNLVQVAKNLRNAS